MTTVQLGGGFRSSINKLHPKSTPVVFCGLEGVLWWVIVLAAPTATLFIVNAGTGDLVDALRTRTEQDSWGYRNIRLLLPEETTRVLVWRSG